MNSDETPPARKEPDHPSRSAAAPGDAVTLDAHPKPAPPFPDLTRAADRLARQFAPEPDACHY